MQMFKVAFWTNFRAKYYNMKAVKVNRVELVAENIKQLRKAKGWSQTQLADKISSHLSHVSRIETGKYPPSLDDMIKIADILEVPLEQLVAPAGKNNGIDTITDTPLYQKIKLIEQLDEKDKATIINVIDSILTKHKMKGLLDNVTA
jgi:transcriptional regulator with XRE-family HTH domain